MVRLCLVAVAIVLAGLAGAVHAADQLAPTKLLLVKDKNGSQPSTVEKKKLKLLVKNGPSSSLNVQGDPTVAGAVLWISLTNNSQCFVLPPEGWSAMGPLGFKYRDPGPNVTPLPPVRGGIKSVSIQRTVAGNFIVKVRALSKKGPITLNLFGGPFQGYLLLRGGDRYCVAGPEDGLANGFVYRVQDASAPAACGASIADTSCSPSGAFLD